MAGLVAALDSCMHPWRKLAMLSSNRILRGGLPHASQSCATARLATNRAWGSAVTELIKNKNKAFIILPYYVLFTTSPHLSKRSRRRLIPILTLALSSHALRQHLGTLAWLQRENESSGISTPGLYTIAKRLPGPEVLAGATANPRCA